jgi:hypothetical protein
MTYFIWRSGRAWNDSYARETYKDKSDRFNISVWVGRVSKARTQMDYSARSDSGVLDG